MARFVKRISLAILVIAVVLAAIVLLSPGAVRPVNPRLAEFGETFEHQFERLEANRGEHDDLVVLAFSGGGTRAASFSYGVLEALRRIEITSHEGRTMRLLDEVDLITGVSGGSFTALAYGLYGEKLFTDYEQQFLKRDVQKAITLRTLNPLNWHALLSRGWGRSELAANLYDEVLFHGATFADLESAGGPVIVVGATELATGSRVVFVPQNFDVMCADLHGFRLARAAASSSAVPVVLAPLTINNYGGTCGYQEPPWLEQFRSAEKPPRPAGRVLKRLRELEELDNAVEDPYFHLVDGGVSDNLGLRGVLDSLETFEALRLAGHMTRLDHIRRLILIVVNAVSVPSTDWNLDEDPPATLSVLMKATGVPIQRYSSESVELLRDIDARWAAMRHIRDSIAASNQSTVSVAGLENAPNVDIFTVEVSFQVLQDRAERDYLNQLPTSFVLSPEQVDRLRAAAASILVASPDLMEALAEEHVHVLDPGPN